MTEGEGEGEGGREIKTKRWKEELQIHILPNP
jgi:hypothetical protein